MSQIPIMAYFSMEIALEPKIPTYSGGLGVLAGDLLRSAADLKIPMVGVTLLPRQGYFNQRLDPNGWQTEEPVRWVIEDFLKPLPSRISLVLEGRTVVVRAWLYSIIGSDGFVVPVYLLDTDLPENTPKDRELTHRLYGGDARYRLCQETIFGIGGVRMLTALGYERIHRFHMNEGHASLLTFALLEEVMEGRQDWVPTSEDLQLVRRRCVFTTHTPVPAGHDQFPMDMVNKVFGPSEIMSVPALLGGTGVLNMTALGMNLSEKINAVSKRHGEISRKLFAPHPVQAITNGVHAPTWTSAPFQELFDRRIPGWKRDNFALRAALILPQEEVWASHQAAKTLLFETIRRLTQSQLDVNRFTLGFARRAAGYKRLDLIFSDKERLKRITEKFGPLQMVFAGKAHPDDRQGKELIQRIIKVREELKEYVRVVYLENYDMELGKLITAGVDVWLNNPEPPLEASGTSGMKAALNGVPSLSTLDGWWVEGHLEGITGWAIGEDYSPTESQNRTVTDVQSLYEKLENVIVPLFIQQRENFIQVMRTTIAVNGSFFNTHRMVQQYVSEAYFL